jgi:hypothetical protein
MIVTTVGQSLWRKESARIAVGKKGQAVVVRAAYMMWISIRVIVVIHLCTDHCYIEIYILTCSLGSLKYAKVQFSQFEWQWIQRSYVRGLALHPKFYFSNDTVVKNHYKTYQPFFSYIIAVILRWAIVK